jgi:hypothetical protein
MKRAAKDVEEKSDKSLDPGFARVTQKLLRRAGVAREQRKGFGSGALKVNGKIFAMMDSRERFVVKLPHARVDELVTSGKGERWEPGPGRTMKEWVTVPTGGVDWIALAEEAYEFVKKIR